jgi:hypothetical protein
LVAAPAVLHCFIPPRPFGTCRVIEESYAPLWPGSRKMAIPAIFGAADVLGVLLIGTSMQTPATTTTVAINLTAHVPALTTDRGEGRA